MIDTKYLELFKLIAQNVSNLAEKVLETAQDEKAENMRNDYLNLITKIDERKELDKKDFARLLIGANIVVQNLTKQVEKVNTALKGYKLDVIPKLQQIMETDDDTLLEKIFKISE